MLDVTHVRNVKEACERLQACTKKADKVETIRNIRDMNVWDAIRLFLNPLIVSGIKEKSLGKTIPESVQPESALLTHSIWLEDMLVWLNNKSGVSDRILKAIQMLISSLPEDLQPFASQYLCKTLRLGVTAKTVNEALGHPEIPVMECMLANKYFEHTKAVEGKEFALTEKLDGIRAIAVCSPTRKVKIYSRQGQLIEGLTDIEEDIQRAAIFLERGSGHKDGFVLDGELLIDHRNRFPSKEQYKQTTMIVRKDGAKKGVVYHVFDCIPYMEFMFSKGEKTYIERRKFLEEQIFQRPLQHVVAVPILYQGMDAQMITKHLNKEMSLGHEGVMINLLDAPYRFGRTSDILKVKVMQDCDLRIIDAEEGSGRFAGTLGALVVDYRGNELRVGSGFTQAERDMFWKDPGAYIGRVITVQYFEVTEDKDGKLSLRFPVFLRLREEGKDVSYY